MPPPPSQDLKEQLSESLSLIRIAMTRSTQHLNADETHDFHLRLEGWIKEITVAFNATCYKWTDEQAQDVLAALMGLVPMIVRSQIKEIGALIQGWQIRKFPSIRLEPLINCVPILHSEGPAYNQPLPPVHHARSPPSAYHPPSSPTHHYPESQGDLMLREAAAMFDPHFPGHQSNYQSVQLQQGPSPAHLALPAADLSYHRELFNLFPTLRAAWKDFVESRCSAGEWVGLLQIYDEWERGVKAYVPMVWASWSTAHEGVGKRQARELVWWLQQLICGGVFPVFPPKELFELLPCSSGTFEHLAFQLILPSPSTNPSLAAQLPPPNTVTAQYYRHFVQEYKGHLEQLLHDHPHLQLDGQHQHQQHSLHYPPPHPNEHNIQELARWHRRMTDRQAKRYGTTSKAFAAAP